MADDRPDPLADLFTLFAAPLSGTVRSIEQFRKGVDEFLNGVENFNRTMANLNETSERINSLLIDLEEPLRAAVPQVTRTVRTADEVMQVVSGPAMAVAPGLNRLAETLSTPAFAQLPSQISQFSEVLGEVSKRLGPLTQFAESAGGLFGGFRLPGTRPAATHDDPPAPVAPTSAAAGPTTPVVTEERATAPAPRPVVAEKSVATRATGKKPAAKKAAGKKSAAKKATGKKSAAKKATGKKSAAKKAPANKPS